MDLSKVKLSDVDLIALAGQVMGKPQERPASKEEAAGRLVSCLSLQVGSVLLKSDVDAVLHAEDLPEAEKKLKRVLAKTGNGPYTPIENGETTMATANLSNTSKHEPKKVRTLFPPVDGVVKASEVKGIKGIKVKETAETAAKAPEKGKGAGKGKAAPKGKEPAKAPAKKAAAKEKAPVRESFGRKSVHSGKSLHPKHTEDGKLVNPRREGTHGFNSYSILLKHPGIKYEDYIAKGGRHNDLAWDIAHDYVKVG
jgi:hypothetical protein